MVQTNLIGKTILGYTVGEKLGSGAFGTVYKVIKTNVSGQYIRALKHITIPTEKQYNSVLNSMGGDVSKADSYFAQMLQTLAMTAGFEDIEKADQVRFHISIRVGNGVTHTSLCCKVDDHRRLVLL